MKTNREKNQSRYLLRKRFRSFYLKSTNTQVWAYQGQLKKSYQRRIKALIDGFSWDYYQIQLIFYRNSRVALQRRRETTKKLVLKSAISKRISFCKLINTMDNTFRRKLYLKLPNSYIVFIQNYFDDIAMRSVRESFTPHTCFQAGIILTFGLLSFKLIHRFRYFDRLYKRQSLKMIILNNICSLLLELISITIEQPQEGASTCNE